MHIRRAQQLHLALLIHPVQVHAQHQAALAAIHIFLAVNARRPLGQHREFIRHLHAAAEEALIREFLAAQRKAGLFRVEQIRMLPDIVKRQRVRQIVHADLHHILVGRVAGHRHVLRLRQRAQRAAQRRILPAVEQALRLFADLLEAHPLAAQRLLDDEQAAAVAGEEHRVHVRRLHLRHALHMALRGKELSDGGMHLLDVFPADLLFKDLPVDLAGGRLIVVDAGDDALRIVKADRAEHAQLVDHAALAELAVVLLLEDAEAVLAVGGLPFFARIRLLRKALCDQILLDRRVHQAAAQRIGDVRVRPFAERIHLLPAVRGDGQPLQADIHRAAAHVHEHQQRALRRARLNEHVLHFILRVLHRVAHHALRLVVVGADLGHAVLRGKARVLRDLLHQRAVRQVAAHGRGEVHDHLQAVAHVLGQHVVDRLEVDLAQMLEELRRQLHALRVFRAARFRRVQLLLEVVADDRLLVAVFDDVFRFLPVCVRLHGLAVRVVRLEHHDRGNALDVLLRHQLGGFDKAVFPVALIDVKRHHRVRAAVVDRELQLVLICLIAHLPVLRYLIFEVSSLALALAQSLFA